MKTLRDIFNSGFSPAYPPLYNKMVITVRDGESTPFPVGKVVTLTAYPFTGYKAGGHYKPISRIIGP